MKIAVAYEAGRISQHFDKTPAFKLYSIEEGQIVKAEVLSTDSQEDGALVTLLASRQIDVLICGGIHAAAKDALDKNYIHLYCGADGWADDAVKLLLDGKLASAPNVECHHHEYGVNYCAE